ncbi:MAG: tRNA(Ile)-lysidine synthetase, partial [Bacteroidales bacterium]|nr:tRNA(Ile)-lysidine synthetase [Bacteroidales bacterium]
MTLLEEFQDYAARNALFTKNDRILLAVSGGIDSMVMLHLFKRMGADAVSAHCNFRLRGVESDMDEELVRYYSGKNNIPFHSVSFDTRKFAGEKGISIQMAARDLRYEWFEKIRTEQGCRLIAVAHNL